MRIWGTIECDFLVPPRIKMAGNPNNARDNWTIQVEFRIAVDCGAGRGEWGPKPKVCQGEGRSCCVRTPSTFCTLQTAGEATILLHRGRCRRLARVLLAALAFPNPGGPNANLVLSDDVKSLFVPITKLAVCFLRALHSVESKGRILVMGELWP